MSTRVEELEFELADAKRAATPVITEVIKHDHQEKVAVSSNSTTRTDYLGGQPAKVPRKVIPVVERPLTLKPVSKAWGRLSRRMKASV